MNLPELIRHKRAQMGGIAVQKARSKEDKESSGKKLGLAIQQQRTEKERIRIGKLGGKARWKTIKAQLEKEKGEFKSGGSKPLGFARLTPKQRHDNAVRAGKRSAKLRGQKTHVIR